MPENSMPGNPMLGYRPTTNIAPGGGYDFNRLPSLAQMLARQQRYQQPQQPVAPLGGIPGGQWMMDQINNSLAYFKNNSRQAAKEFQDYASGGRYRPYRTDYSAPPPTPQVKR